MAILETFSENIPQYLFLGIVLLFLGSKFGGHAITLLFKGVRTEAVLSRIEFCPCLVDHEYRTRYKCFFKFSLLNGKEVEYEYHDVQKEEIAKRKEGETFTVVYNPKKPEDFEVNIFWFPKLFGIVATLTGFAFVCLSLVSCVNLIKDLLIAV